MERGTDIEIERLKEYRFSRQIIHNDKKKDRVRQTDKIGRKSESMMTIN